MFLLLFLVTFCLAQFREECLSPLHHGVTNCSNSSSIRYYLDLDTKTCLAFKYTGCGGNSNNFESHSECQNYCVAIGYFECPRSSAPLKNNDGTKLCWTEEHSECDDPHAYCDRGEHFGYCCNATLRDLQNQDYSSECGVGQKKELVQLSGYTIPLLGKSCDSNFCSSGYKCHQGNFYAYCCK